MPEYVIDASVVLKWVSDVNEKLTKESRDLYQALKQGKIILWAPVFLLVEVSNILAKKKKLNPSLHSKALTLLINSGIGFQELTPVDIDSINQLLFKYQITAYDAIYVHLAQQKNLRLITLDQQLLQLKNLSLSLSEMTFTENGP